MIRSLNLRKTFHVSMTCRVTPIRSEALLCVNIMAGQHPGRRNILKNERDQAQSARSVPRVISASLNLPRQAPMGSPVRHQLTFIH